MGRALQDAGAGGARQAAVPANLAQRIAQAAARPLAGFAKLFRGAQADIEEVRRWTPLPETADELCEVGRRLGVPESEILLGTRATEAALKDCPEGPARRLRHFAFRHAWRAHGPGAGPAEPGLILTPPAKGTTDPSAGARRRLPHRVRDRHPQARRRLGDPVGLQYGRWRGETAEALSGMARAFFYAGARALLVSHWEVGSDAAVKLTTRAFAESKSRSAMGRAEAFRLSMRD